MPKRIVVISSIVTAALLSGLIVTAIALAISGGGHGWNSAFISASAVVTLPAGALCWFGRRSRIGQVFATILMSTNLIIVVVLFAATTAEGTEHVVRTWRALPGYVTAWAFLWVGWQVVPVVAILKGVKARGAAG